MAAWNQLSPCSNKSSPDKLPIGSIWLDHCLYSIGWLINGVKVLTKSIGQIISSLLEYEYLNTNIHVRLYYIIGRIFTCMAVLLPKTNGYDLCCYGYV